MRKEDRVKTKLKTDEIKNKPIQQQSESDVNYVIRKQNIIADPEE